MKQSVTVGVRRDGRPPEQLTAVPGEDVVVLHLDGGPSLTLHPEHARDLLLAQSTAERRGAEAPQDGAVEVPAQLRWRGLESAGPTRGESRGFLGDVKLAAIDVVTDLITDIAAEHVAMAVARRVDAQVEAGVYQLASDTLAPLKNRVPRLDAVPSAAGGAPLLVLVHGTFSESSGTFGKLWTHHPQRVRKLFGDYRNRVYALDHPTLTASPVANVLTLLGALPRGARLHLLTHSRGGLVAEVLARCCATPGRAVEVDVPGATGDEIRTAAALAAEKAVQVERIVRVACPARGTLLASRRLDAYLSVFKWTLELAGVPVLPAIVDFLNAVAKVRADPEQLPGLAAQIPDSALVQWLHAVDQPIAGDLRVIAGDIQGDSVVSWLKTLLTDAFFWTDHDLVVQTRSMYGGSPRAEGATFALDRGGKVSHFNYFANDRTAAAIANALSEETPSGFGTIGALSWAGQSATGVRAARAVDDRKPHEKPAVFVLPGILGSHLAVSDDRIWLGWRTVNGLSRLAYKQGVADEVRPDGPIGSVYDDLIDFLSASHDAIPFAFDWRRPIEEEARRLATAVEGALDVRKDSGQPVRLLAHSMGGLVARCLQLERPDVWDRMMAHDTARLLMLGTPNGGSWAPMQVLSGDDTFGNAITIAGAPFREDDARAMLARFPGLLQMQADLLDRESGLGRRETWQQLADADLVRLRNRSAWHDVALQLGVARWGVPPQDVLDRAVELRKRLDAQRDTAFTAAKGKVVVVVGLAAFTPNGFDRERFVYLGAATPGDGRVTLESALLPAVRAWQVDSPHGNLPNRKTAFEGYRELLDKGTTAALAVASDAATRSAPTRAAAASADESRSSGDARPARSRSAEGQFPGEAGMLMTPDARESVASNTPERSALRITVVNGDLTFVEQPLLLGHYRALKLTGTEWVMNTLIGEDMQASLDKGLYPERPGVHQVFLNQKADPDNPWRLPRPRAVVVVGLGQEGALTPAELVDTVRQGVLGWAQRAAEVREAPPSFELAATLIGSGGARISAAQSAQLIAQAVSEANERLDHTDDAAGADGTSRRWPCVSHLRLIELYLDRATDAWRALKLQSDVTPGRFSVDPGIETGVGGLPRPLDSTYRGADYDYVSALSRGGEDGQGIIDYTMDTRRARAEVRAQSTQKALLSDLIEGGANDECTDPLVGQTLFKLLVPVEMESFLAGSTEVQLELDRGTAGVPWELLDARAKGSGDDRPWAIRSKLLRKLRTEEFRSQTVDADADAHVLVIGEPECDTAIYPRLEGARAEARAVARALTGKNALAPDLVQALVSDDEPAVGPDARTVTNALMHRDWRIIHIAGHGEPPERIGPKPMKAGDPPQRDGRVRGVVLSGDSFLGPDEIHSMRTVPELVFLNCCHLAARNLGELFVPDHPTRGRRYNRARFAAGVAEALIKLGVRCVIAAGWAVEDDPAMTFATTFYREILNRQRFIDAVASARAASHALGGNTWAAYQCYGDPDWTLRRGTGDAQRPARPLADRYLSVASPRGLLLALRTIAVESEFQKQLISRPEQVDKLRYLEASFDERWGHMGEVAEAFGKAWAVSGRADLAVEWYQRAMGANDGGASLKAAEQFGNLRVRLAAEAAEKAWQAHGARAANPPAGRRRGRSAKPVAEDKAWTGALAKARTDIAAGLGLLRKVSAIDRTSERESLLGSAYKRLALIEARAGDRKREAAAIRQMMVHYQRAEDLAREQNLENLYYPAMNGLAAELIVNGGRAGWKGFDPSRIGEIRDSLSRQARDNPDFWSVVGLVELQVYEAIGVRDAGGLANLLSKSLERDYRDHHARISVEWMWKSVYDTARFVLEPYRAWAPDAEKEAAATLLELLQGFANARER